MVAESILMFVIGAVFMYGGSMLCIQAFEDAKNVLESVLFSLGLFTIGLFLVIWAFTGPPG